MWWELLRSTLNFLIYYMVINYSHNFTHYVTSTYLSYNWKLVPFDNPHPFLPLPLPTSIYLATAICSLWVWCFFFYKHSYVSKIIQYLSFFDLLHPVFLILEGNMVNNHLLTYLPWWVPGQTVPTSDIFMILKQLYWASWRDLRQGFLTKRASSVQVKFAAR